MSEEQESNKIPPAYFINIINLAQGHRRQKLCEKIEKIALKIFLTFL